MNTTQRQSKSRKTVEPSFSSSEDSDNDATTGKVFRPERKKFLATSHCLNQSYASQPPKQSILSLKQKVAQCLIIIHRKDKQIGQLKEVMAQLEQTNKFNSEKNQQLLGIIQHKNAQIVQQKASYQLLCKNYRVAEQKIQNQEFDRQLMCRQINYYQLQIEQLSKKLLQSEAKLKEVYEESRKQREAAMQGKQQNKKLRSDLKRLKDLLQQTKKYEKFSQSIDNKHYIKSNSHQKQNWVSENLLTNVQDLVKKNKGAKTKEVANTFACFISKYANQMAKQAQKKVKKAFSSRMKDIQRKHNYSLSLMESHGQYMMKSDKTSRKQNKSHLKTFADLSVQQKFQHSFPTKCVSNNIQVCIRILNELRNKLLNESSSRQIKISTINILIDWAIDSLSSSDAKKHVKSLNGSKTSNTRIL